MVKLSRQLKDEGLLIDIRSLPKPLNNFKASIYYDEYRLKLIDFNRPLADLMMMSKLFLGEIELKKEVILAVKEKLQSFKIVVLH